MTFCKEKFDVTVSARQGVSRVGALTSRDLKKKSAIGKSSGQDVGLCGFSVVFSFSCMTYNRNEVVSRTFHDN